jgi:hypothetical protein
MEAGEAMEASPNFMTIIESSFGNFNSTIRKSNLREGKAGLSNN